MHKVPDQKKAIKIKRLVSEPFKHWPNAVKTFKSHENAADGIHNQTLLAYKLFISECKGKTVSVDEIIISSSKAKVLENRKKLIPIIDAIKICGRLGIALRGHRDSADFHPNSGSSSGAVGNLIELLNYGVRRGDLILKQHLDTCAKNASYLSPSIQNELINIIGSLITQKIIQEVKKARFYSIIADEASDISCKEQMSLVLRFVDSDYNIREDFVKYIHCKRGLSGEALAEQIVDTLEDLGLKIEHCRGQGYDGAGAVAGRVKGVSARIQKKNHKAIFTHCFNHRLNLCVCKACLIQNVRNMLDRVKSICYFFNLSEPRNSKLQENIKIHAPEESRTKLVDVCKTRWIERIKGLEIFYDLFPVILKTFHEMSLNLDDSFNSETSSKAKDFLKLVNNFEFVVSLVITRCVFDMTLDVTQLLQGKTNDICDGIHLIKSLKDLIARCRSESKIQDYHDEWYGEALKLAQSCGIKEVKPRTCCRQIYRANHPVKGVSDYFKVAITVPLLDYLNSELKDRFDESSLNAYFGMCVIPDKMIRIIENKDSAYSYTWKEKFKSFCMFYLDDLPGDELKLDAEMKVWEEYWVKYSDLGYSLPDNSSKTLKHFVFKEGYENIRMALKILATLPVTSCECERSFSSLRRLKTFTRSTMGEERLNGLAMMYIHKDIDPSEDEVLNQFCASGKRRMDLSLV